MHGVDQATPEICTIVIADIVVNSLLASEFARYFASIGSAHAIGWEVFHEGKKGRERELAYSLALQGLGEATLELNREALWHWSMAQMLLPELEGEVLQAYSGIAELFDSSPFRSRVSAVAWIEQESRLLTPGGDFTAPVVAAKQRWGLE